MGRFYLTNNRALSLFPNIPYLYSLTEYPEGDDVIYGGTGNDFVYAKSDDDEVYGGEGNDTITGDMGYDFIEGGSGDDILIGCIDDFFHKKCLSKSLDRGIDNFHYRLEI